MGCEGFELHILHWPHMDSIDLDQLMSAIYFNFTLIF
jgi:hypothetical protein